MARNHGRPRGRKPKLSKNAREKLRRRAQWQKKLAQMTPEERQAWRV